MNTNEAFAEAHKGKYAVRQAGILVRLAFNTEAEAAEWAKRNYRNPENWTVEQL